MPEKNIPRIPFDERSLPISPLSKEKMEELEERLIPYVEEIKKKLSAEPQEKRKILNNF